jgi:hypothetical protein
MPVPFVLVARFLGAGILDAIEANEARAALGIAAKEAGLEGALDEEKPEFTPVNSTAIRGIGYRPKDTIVVEFVRGGTYSYDGPYELYQAFIHAPSKGQFFNNHFRGDRQTALQKVFKK